MLKLKENLNLSKSGFESQPVTELKNKQKSLSEESLGDIVKITQEIILKFRTSKFSFCICTCNI